MKSLLLYKLLYFLCLMFTGILCFIILPLKNLFYGSRLLIQINFVLVGVFYIFMIKRNLRNVNNLFPMLYLMFFGILLIEMLIYDNKVIIPYLHYNYFVNFILVDYLFLNVYSLLSLKK